jgi:large subunit ribosomal protein L13
MKKNKTYMATPEDITRDWHLFNAEGAVLGRMASRIAQQLIGKDKVYYTPHLDCGDYVVVTNAAKVKLTGKKAEDKVYFRHSGYPGGLKKITLPQQMEKDPRKVVELAVKNMLPKNKLRSKRMRRLKVFVDEKHPYEDKLKGGKDGKEK